MEPRLVSAGGLLLFFSSLTAIETGLVAPATPLYAAAGVSLAIAVGSLAADVRRRNRPVRSR